MGLFTGSVNMQQVFWRLWKVHPWDEIPASVRSFWRILKTRYFIKKWGGE